MLDFFQNTIYLGAPWTEEHASIIKLKLYRLAQKGKKYTKDVDLGINTATDSTRYIYDPNMTTVIPDYEKCVSKKACDDQFKGVFLKKFLYPRFILKKFIRD